MKKLLLVLLAAVFLAAFAGCASGMVNGVDVNKLSPKQKSTMLWKFYKDQFIQYGVDYDRWDKAAPGDVRTALAKSLVARKKALADLKAAIEAYDAWFVATATDYSSVEEWEAAKAVGPDKLYQKATDLMFQLGGL